MKLKKFIAVFSLLVFCFSMVNVPNTAFADRATLPAEYDFESETDGLPDNWQAYRKTFESLEHPFLLTKESDFETLISRAETEPWKSLKENAENVVKNFTHVLEPTAGQSTETQWKNFAVVIGDYALMYILDEENRETYKNEIVRLLGHWDKNRAVNLYDGIYNADGDSWDQAIPPANPLINSILALDIVHPSLADDEIFYCESVVGDAAQKFFDHTEVHYTNTYGVRTIWAAYIKDYDLLYENYSLYMQHFAVTMLDNGFTADAFDYAVGRYATDDRLGKVIAPLVVKKIGISNDFFDWDASKGYGLSIVNYMNAPNGTRWPIGDGRFYSSLGEDALNGQALLPYYASYFSEEAAANAAWYLENVYKMPQYKVGTLMAYLLCETPLSEAVQPKSKAWEEGGAFLYENMKNKSSLGALLYNLGVGAEGASGHGHNETNSLSVAAYNQLLLANAGYNSWGKGIDGYSWLYIHGSAYSTNTVLIDYEPGDIKDPSAVNNHAWVGAPPYPKGTGGDGIKKTLFTDLFAYASGDTGEERHTLPNGRHIRNTAMIAAQDGVPGYFAVFDEITSDSPEVYATVMWRPVSTDYSVPDGDSWRWHVTAQKYDPADVTIHTTEHPDEANIVDGIIAAWASSVPMKCLEAKFKTDKNGRRDVSTIIFPSNAQNPEADISRFEGTGIKGSKVDFGNGVADYVMYTTADGVQSYYVPVEEGISYERIQLDGSWAVCRKISGANGFMFAMNATQLLSGEQGFSSSAPVDFYLKEGKGKIVCTGDTTVTIKDYGIKEILVDSAAAELKSSSISHTITLSEGEHEIDIIYDETKRAHEIINSQVAFGSYNSITAIDTANGDVIVNGEYKKGGLQSALKVIDGTSYVSKDFAASVLGISLENETLLDSVSYIPLRYNAENSGYTVYWDNSGFILLIPESDNFNAQKDAPFIGINSLIFNKVYQTKEPYMPFEANDISINGEPLPGFSPSVYTYNFNVFEDKGISAIDVNADVDVKVNMPPQLPGTAEIILSDFAQSKTTTSYYINIKPVPAGGVLNVSASDVPQPENPAEAACDGDLSTRWSSNTAGCWIVFDLGSEKDITSVETAWYRGNTRINYFDIQFSSDNANWTTVYSGQSTGATADLAASDGTSGRARYVRIVCHGASTTAWNSLSECKINTK